MRFKSCDELGIYKINESLVQLLEKLSEYATQICEGLVNLFKSLLCFCMVLIWAITLPIWWCVGYLYYNNLYNKTLKHKVWIKEAHDADV